MQLSIRSKLLLGGSAMAIIFATAAIVGREQTRMLRENLDRITTVENPLKDAALAMEVNMLGTGFGVLAYFQTNDPEQLTHIRDDSEDFARYLGRYELLAQDPQLKELGRRANSYFLRFREIGNQLIKSKNDHSHAASELLGSIATTKRLTDQFLKLVTIDPSTPRANEKRAAARDVQESIDAIEHGLLGFHAIGNLERWTNVKLSTAKLAHHQERLAAMPPSAIEKTVLVEIVNGVTAIDSLVEQISANEESSRRALTEFVHLRHTLDRLLDHDIHEIVTKQVQSAQETLHANLLLSSSTLAGLLVIGLGVGVLSGLAVYRGITRPVQRLHADFQAMARGETVTPASLNVAGEFADLAGAFGDMVEARRRAEEATRALNADLENRIAHRTSELDRINRTLALKSEYALHVTKMSELLQTANSLAEAGTILGRTMPLILTNYPGALYLSTSGTNRFSRLAHWGNAQIPDEFDMQDCWAERRGGAYAASDADHDVFCEHMLATGNHAPYICVPMIAHGTSLGLLHVQFTLHADWADRQDDEHLKVQQLADQVALALANLKLRESLREQSLHDALTGLYNRRSLEDTLSRDAARASRDGVPLAVIMIDVDHFKRYNDQHGHEGGDAVLAALGELLNRMSRASDLMARYGGEEFTALLPNTSLEGARTWGERLMQAVRRLDVICAGNQLPPVTISMGLAICPENGTRAHELLRAADAALYRAKNAGRDRLVVAEVLKPETPPASDEELAPTTVDI